MTTRTPEPQTIRNDGDSKRYFHQMLNMAEDELDPFQYRLLGHYLRWAGHGGSAPEGIRDTAEKTQMSITKVRSARAELVKLGYLKVKEPTKDEQKLGKATEITVLDRWQENVARYTHVLDLAQVGVSEIAQSPVLDLAPLNNYKENIKDASPQPIVNIIELPKPIPEQKPKRKHPNADLRDALVRKFKHDPTTLRGAPDKPYWRVAAELKALDFTPEDAEGLYDFVDEKAKAGKWNSWTVNALPKYAEDYRQKRTTTKPSVLDGLKLITADNDGEVA